MRSSSSYVSCSKAFRSIETSGLFTARLTRCILAFGLQQGGPGSAAIAAVGLRPHPVFRQVGDAQAPDEVGGGSCDGVFSSRYPQVFWFRPNIAGVASAKRTVARFSRIGYYWQEIEIKDME